MKKQPRHTAGPPKKGRGKVSRTIYICIGIVYLLATMGATAYSLTAYRGTLPQVELFQAPDGHVPKSCLQENPDGSLSMNTVERQEGPWGNRYVVKQLTLYSYQELPDGSLFVYEAIGSENPIVASATAGPLCDGMEVRIS